MNNADIGQLHNTNYDWQTAQRKLSNGETDCGHIDWANGRLVRLRQKTKGKAKSRMTVCYKLWDETLALLAEHRSEDKRYCLVSAEGTPLWFRGTKHKDNIYQDWSRAKMSPTLKELRSGGATVLEGHPTFKLYIPNYLADSPRNIPDKFYVKPSQDQFDAAIRWLGDQLGIR
jgi:hypothetical protein